MQFIECDSRCNVTNQKLVLCH